jgi:hypothetical protein
MNRNTILKKGDKVVCNTYLSPKLNKGTIHKIYDVEERIKNNKSIRFEKDGVWWDIIFFKLCEEGI